MKLISVHTPKSSGTALAAALRAIYGDALAVETCDDPANPLSPRIMDPVGYENRRRALPEGILCLHGHFHPAQFRPAAAPLFTMLREPVQNLVSIYFYWKSIARHGNPLHDYWLDNNLGLIETAQLPALRWLFSRTYFGDFDMRRFTLIGCYEERDATMRSLSQLTGAPVDVTVRENVTGHDPIRAGVLGNQRLLSRLQDILIEDMRFYERFAARYSSAA